MSSYAAIKSRKFFWTSKIGLPPPEGPNGIKEETGFILYAYVLTPNHVHLLIETTGLVELQRKIKRNLSVLSRLATISDSAGRQRL